MVTLSKLALLSGALVGAVVAAGCAAPTPSGAPFTVVQLKNAEYISSITSGKRAQLTDGQYQEELAPGLASKLTIQMLDAYATGDLNGDGAPDAAVFLATNMGGSGVFVDLQAVLNVRGQPESAALVRLGDRVQIKGVSIEQGTIEVDLLTQAPTDPLCCPTLRVTEKYALQGRELNPVQ